MTAVYFFLIYALIYIVYFGVSDFIYVDECGINRYYYRTHGYSKRGVRIAAKKSGKKYKRTNIIGALWGNLHIAMRCYEQSIKSVIFEDWFEFELIPLLRENAVVIMDNASFHRKSVLYKIAKRYGVHILFLPPYSPELNHIETSWANFKYWLQDNSERFPCLDMAVDYYFSI